MICYFVPMICASAADRAQATASQVARQGLGGHAPTAQVRRELIFFVAASIDMRRRQ
jgi:hypothetical protein